MNEESKERRKEGTKKEMNEEKDVFKKQNGWWKQKKGRYGRKGRKGRDKENKERIKKKKEIKEK